VDAVPEQLLFRKSGCAGNRTRIFGSVPRISGHWTTEAVLKSLIIIITIIIIITTIIKTAIVIRNI
jgi:hypothetical protein